MSKHNFNWEYCECGCKGSCVDIAGIHFWYHLYLHEGAPAKYCLVVKGHGLGHLSGYHKHYNDYEELEDHVAEVVAEWTPRLRKQLEEAESIR